MKTLSQHITEGLNTNKEDNQLVEEQVEIEKEEAEIEQKSILDLGGIAPQRKTRINKIILSLTPQKYYIEITKG